MGIGSTPGNGYGTLQCYLSDTAVHRGYRHRREGTPGEGGDNCKQGTATLFSGTVTVANASVTANSRIFLTVQSLSGVSTPQAIAVTSRIAGTSFTIQRASTGDTSIIAYEIFEPG